MHPDTHLVIQLQSLDQRIAALEKEVAALPKHIAAIEKTLESHVRKLEADRAALVANQKDRKKFEGEIQVHEQKISKLRDQMLGAKTNEQYRAFQHEIEYAEKEIRKAEDRILELMTESEPLDQNVKKAEMALKEEKQTVESEKTTGARTNGGRSDHSSTELQAERAATVAKLPPAIVTTIRAHPQEMAQQRGHRGSGRRELLRLPDRAAAAIHAGSEEKRAVDDLRKLRPIPLLRPPVGIEDVASVG